MIKIKIDFLNIIILILFIETKKIFLNIQIISHLLILKKFRKQILIKSFHFL